MGSDDEIENDPTVGEAGEEKMSASKKKRLRKKAADQAAAAAAAEGGTAASSSKAPAEDTAKLAGDLAAVTIDDDAEGGEDEAGAGGDAKKKKKRKRGKGTGMGGGMPAQDNSALRCLGNWKATQKQTWPPTKGVSQLWTPETMPLGECTEYKNQGWRTTSEEKREAEKLLVEDYGNIRRAAEVHRQVRRYVQSWVRPGIPMYEMCQRLEAKTLELVEKDGLECGWGFPTGCSLNHVAAHYTPNYGDKTVLTYNDVCKLDFGVQVKGRIIDSAFTIAFNPRYDPAIKCTQDATNVGLSLAGVDARFSEIGAAIQETIESYEVEIDGTVYPMKPIRNLNGHSISPYQIHGGKSVPIVKNSETHVMEEGEMYAIETFASTGKGYVIEDLDCSHYMKIFDAQKVPLRVKSAKNLLHSIERHFGTLAFCRRWLDDLGEQRHLMALKNLVDSDLIQPYPPLVDVKGCYTTQMEHTVLIKPTGREVVSRGEDY